MTALELKPGPRGKNQGINCTVTPFRGECSFRLHGRRAEDEVRDLFRIVGRHPPTDPRSGKPKIKIFATARTCIDVRLALILNDTKIRHRGVQELPVT